MKHLAIIADGNRRWAAKNGLPFQVGYIQGLTVIERCCDWAIQNKIPYLTTYCFSTENWGRPQEEVSYLMELANQYFDDKREWYFAKGIKVNFMGRRDRLPQEFVKKMGLLEAKTKDCQNLSLTICVDYGGRDEIARIIAMGAKTEQEINKIIFENTPAPDAIYRTGGERRLSNFMLWQAAYSELFFNETLFPELDSFELDRILKEYRDRKRNFGK